MFWCLQYFEWKIQDSILNLGRRGGARGPPKLGCWLLFSIVFCNTLMVEESKICDFRLKIRRGTPRKGGGCSESVGEGDQVLSLPSVTARKAAPPPDWVLIGGKIHIQVAGKHIFKCPKLGPNRHVLYHNNSVWTHLAKRRSETPGFFFFVNLTQKVSPVFWGGPQTSFPTTRPSSFSTRP